MRMLWALLVCCVLIGGQVAAQQGADDGLEVRAITTVLSPDRTTVIVAYNIVNRRATPSPNTVVRLFDASGLQIASAPVQPLEPDESTTMRFTVDAARFPAGGVEPLYIVIGLDRLPAAADRRSPSIGTTSIIIPPATVVVPTDVSQEGVPESLLNELRRTVEELIAAVDQPLREQIAGGIAIVGAAIVLLWLVSVIARALRPAPPLGAWQPPYVINTLIDPNSTAGRQQAWQTHAQSDQLPLPCNEADYQARKLLLSGDGRKLSGWRLLAIKIGQYDGYGRIARTQVTAKRSISRAIESAIKRQPTFERALQSMRPPARALIRAVSRRISKRTAPLPLSVDLRFAGLHGEIRIVFELYACQGQGWTLIDTWQPELRLTDDRIQENYTYSLYGRRPDETPRRHQQRLQEELARILAQMIAAPPPMPSRPAARPRKPTPSPIPEPSAEDTPASPAKTGS